MSIRTRSANVRPVPADAISPGHAEALEPRRLLAAVSWDGGGDGVNWTSLNNWSANALPGVADDVTINIAANPTINLNGANAVINSLTSAEALNLNSGTLSMAIGSSSSAPVTLSGATLTGTGNFTLNAGLTWTDGTMRGAGKTVIPTGTSSTSSGTSSRTLARTLEVAGTLNVTGAHVIFMGTGSEIGTLDILSGGTANFSANANLSNQLAGSGVVVRVGGTLTKSGAAPSPTIGVPLSILGGTVSATAGALNLSSAVTGTGGVVEGVGTGLVRLTGGNQAYSGTLLRNVELAGATLNGAGTVTVDNLTWTDGTMRGTGTTVIPAGTSSTSSGTSSRTLARTLEVAGTLNVTGAHVIFMGTGSEAGTLDVQSGGVANFSADANLSNQVAGSGVVVRSGGTLTKSGAAPSPTIGVPLTLLSGGTVSATAGVLALSSDVTGTGGVVEGVGTGLVRLTGGNQTYSGTLLRNVELAGATLDGAGTVTVDNLTWTSGVMRGAGKTVIPTGTSSTSSGTSSRTLARTLEVAGTLNVTGAHVIFMGTGSEIGTLDILSGGTANFSANANLSNQLAGSGVVVRVGGTLTKSGAAPSPTIGVPLSILGGTVSATAGALNLSSAVTGTGGVVEGVGTGLVRLTGGNQAYSGTLLRNVELAGATLNGAGTVTVDNLTWTDGTMRGTGTTVIPAGTSSTSSGTSSRTLARTLEVAGTLNVTGAHVIFMGTGSEAGTLDVQSGGVANFSADANLSNQVAGSGVVVRSGGTLTKSAGAGTATVGVPFTNTGTVNADVGTLRFSSTTNIGAGTFLSAGRYFVASGATLAFSQAVTTNTADFEIAGFVLGTSTLNTNRGRIAFTGGADGTITPSGGTFTHEGIIDLSPDSTFAVTGSMRFAGVSQPVIRTELASAASFGRLTVSGSLNLASPDSTSRIDPDLVGGYDPAIGTRHDVIVANGGITNAFDSFQGGETPSDNVLLVTRPNANTLAIDVGPGPLPEPPRILSTAYEFETRQAIVFTFDQDVSAFLDRGDVLLENLTTGQTLPQSAGILTYNQTSNQATLLLTNELADGNWQMTVASSDIANAAGVPGNEAPIVLEFYVLAGDANRDRRVNLADFGILRANFGQSGRTFSQGDFDYNGIVNLADFGILRSRFGVFLPPPDGNLFGGGGGGGGGDGAGVLD